MSLASPGTAVHGQAAAHGPLLRTSTQRKSLSKQTTAARRGMSLAALLMAAGLSILASAAQAQTPQVKETLPNAGTSRDNAAQGAFLNVVSVASTRLSLSQTFAAWAWQEQHAGKSPGDLQRDDDTEQNMIKMAPHFGLSAEFADAVIRDQTKAGEELQATLFAEWQHGGTPPQADASSYQSARGSLYQLSQSLLGALTQIEPLSDRNDCPMMLSQAITHWTTHMATLSAEQRKSLQTALAHVCRGGIGGTA